MCALNDDAKRAAEMHEKICAALHSLRATKVDVYLLLREFHRSKLFRHLRLPPAPAHAEKICAGRRFTTWEDYLESLGEAGICFGYFAELDRLCERFGEVFVRLCGKGVPVRTRRLLLKASERVAREVRTVAASDVSDADKLETIDGIARDWRFEYETRERRWESALGRVASYRRHAVGWEAKLAEIVRAVAEASGSYRGGTVAQRLVSAWREIFEAHLEIGERLAGLALGPELGAHHAEFIRLVSDAWGPRALSDPWALPALPPSRRRSPDDQANRASRTGRAAERRRAAALPRAGPRRVF